MSEYNLGTAKGTIEIDYKGNGPAQAREDLKGTGKAASSASDALDKTGKAAGVAGLGIAAGLGLAVKTAADFEKGLSGIEAVSGATSGEMDQVRKKALQLGADTAFSASESAAAMEELVKAGLTIPDVMNGAADATVALAAAGGVAMPEAAAIAGNAMNQFGLSAEQMPKIADKIAGAANASAIDVSDFGMSMSQAGAVAKLAGLSFDDTALAITAMGNAGIKGSDAGTSLKTFLQNLQPQTKKQVELMKELGLMTEKGGNQFFDAAGKIKPMNQIAGVLGKSLKGMSDAQKTATLETLFGSDAIRAAAVIAGEGTAGMDALTKSIDKVSAADVAKTRMNNLSGQVEQLKGSAETLAIQLGTVLVPVFKDIVTALTDAVNWFTQLSDSQQQILVTVLAVTAGVLLFVAGIIKLVAIARTIKSTILGLKAAMVLLNGTFLANPVFLIIMALIALGAALVLLYKKNETFRNFVNKAWAMIKGAISAVVTWITGTAVPWIVNAWNSIVAGAQWLWNMIKTIFVAIVTAVTAPIRLLVTLVMAYVTMLLTFWRGVWNLFGPIVVAIWNLIKVIIQVALAWIKTIILTTLNLIKAGWTAVWNGIKQVIAVTMSIIRSIISSVMNAILGVVNAVWGKIGGTVMRVVNTIKGHISAGFNAAKGVVTSVFSAISGVISSQLERAKSIVSSAISSIKGFFSGAGSWLMDAGRRIIQGLIDGITSMVSKVSGAINSVTDKIRGFLPGSPIKEGPLRDHGWNEGRPGKQLMQNLAAGVESEKDLLARAFSGVSTDLSDGLGSTGVALTASAGRTALSGSSGGPSGSAPGLRLLEGTLGLSPDGKVFIQGVAQEVYDSNDNFAGTHGRMGGF